MDDFVVSNLYESRNEWCSRLVSVLTPLIIEGVRSIFNESYKMCVENNECSKYLMTFQNLLSRIPKWNDVIIEGERKRIVERSNCLYLEDLVTCVHIIQLKILTCVRVGNKQKQIDIAIPKIDNFIHKVYIQVARKLYTNTYLFETAISQLQTQKNGREIELIVQECILRTIRESIPTEDIIRAYTDESVEHEEEVTIEHIPAPVPDPALTVPPAVVAPAITSAETATAQYPTMVGVKNKTEDAITTTLKFNDYDNVLSSLNTVNSVNAPKTLARLEEISVSNAMQRKQAEAESDDDSDNCKMKILSDSEPVSLTGITVVGAQKSENEVAAKCGDGDSVLLTGIESLD